MSDDIDSSVESSQFIMSQMTNPHSTLTFNTDENSFSAIPFISVFLL